MRQLKRLFAFMLVAAVASPGLAVAQSERERRKEERAKREAEHALQEAQEEMHEAQEEMRQAEREFQRAAREYARQRSEIARELGREKAETARELARMEREVARELARNRVVMYSDDARLGILVGSDSDDERPPRGVKIQGLTPGGPAEEAGLASGDIITKIDGRPLVVPGQEESDEDSPAARLSEMVSGLKDGQQVKVEYLRGKMARRTTVTARRLYGRRMKVMPAPEISYTIPEIHIPDIELPEIVMPEIALAYQRGYGDLELLTLNPELAEYFGVSEGVLVVETPKRGALQLKAGDVILKIGGRAPRSPAQTLRILRSYDAGEQVTVEIMRDRQSVTLSVEMPKRSTGWGYLPVAPAPPAKPAVPAPSAAPAVPAPPATGYRNRL